MKTAWTKVQPRTKKIQAIWARKNSASNRSSNRFRNFSSSSKRCRWDRPIIPIGPIKATAKINRNSIRNMIRIMTMASDTLMKMIEIWIVMKNREKKSILMMINSMHQWWTLRRRKVKANNNATLMRVTILTIIIIKSIKNKITRTNQAKNILNQETNKANYQKAMTGTKRKKIEIIIKNEGMNWVKMKEAIQTM